MKVIGIVGYPASGKYGFSSVALENNIPVVVMGDMIRRRVEKEGLELNDENIGNAAKKLREELGQDAVAVLTAKELENISSDIAVIDGIRGDAEIKYFKSVFSDFTLVFVNASFETRLNRMKTRGRSDDTTTAETLLSRDRREESFGLARAAALADIKIDNESSLEEYEEKIKSFFGALK